MDPHAHGLQVEGGRLPNSCFFPRVILASLNACACLCAAGMKRTEARQPGHMQAGSRMQTVRCAWSWCEVRPGADTMAFSRLCKQNV